MPLLVLASALLMVQSCYTRCSRLSLAHCMLARHQACSHRRPQVLLPTRDSACGSAAHHTFPPDRLNDTAGRRGATAIARAKGSAHVVPIVPCGMLFRLILLDFGLLCLLMSSRVALLIGFYFSGSSMPNHVYTSSIFTMIERPTPMQSVVLCLPGATLLFLARGTVILHERPASA
jgi:hypothetical protein